MLWNFDRVIFYKKKKKVCLWLGRDLFHATPASTCISTAYSQNCWTDHFRCPFDNNQTNIKFRGYWYMRGTPFKKVCIAPFVPSLVEIEFGGNQWYYF